MKTALFALAFALCWLVPALSQADEDVRPRSAMREVALASASENLAEEKSSAESLGCACDDACCQDCCDSGLLSMLDSDDWNLVVTQTVGYGTGLALPITLTPNNGAVGNFADDFEFLTNAALQRRYQLDEDTTFLAGIGYYQSLHPEAHQIDLMTPSAQAQLARKFGEDAIGAVDYSYQYYFLDGSSYVSQNRIETSWLQRWSESWDWKIAGGYANADFRQPNDFLDSDNFFARLELLRYLDEERRNYLTTGYAYGRSNAALSGFSYDVNNIFVGGNWRMNYDSRDNFALTAAYADYNFLGPDPFVPAILREDRIFAAAAVYTRTWSPRWSGFGSYTYLNSDSNVARQVYHTNLVSLGVTYSR